jgi:hypothetical protein
MKISKREKTFIALAILSILFTAYNYKAYFSFNKAGTDSGFDSSWDSGSSGGGSDSSSWDSGGSGSSGGGKSVASEEEKMYGEVFKGGFTFDKYFKFVFSLDYVVTLIRDLFFKAFLFFCLYFLTDRKKGVLIYALVSTIPYIILPNIYFFVIEFIGVIIYILIFEKKNKSKSPYQKIDDDIVFEDIDLSEYNIDVNELHKEIYAIYVRVQEAWRDFKLDDVKDVLGDEIYNMYKAQLSTLKAKNQQNIMSDFKYLNCGIRKVEEINNTLVFTARLQVECRDYLVDNGGNILLRGNKKLHKYTYELKLEKSSVTDLDKCPNCSAQLDAKGKTVKCKYCGTTINRNSTNLVLIKKTMLFQE